MTSLPAGRPLDGRVAAVTGATSGMGAATTRRLAELAAAVAVVACRQEKLEALAADIASTADRSSPCPSTSPTPTPTP
ncbi:SDR family NAD(P)-dependent oxidoreductase [Streptomyces sp. ME19-03-3]|nr:SDR family NAD(P)-dependent oxidoreductase [Streptomyces sp. ME19-03-3]